MLSRLGTIVVILLIVAAVALANTNTDPAAPANQTPGTSTVEQPGDNPPEVRSLLDLPQSQVLKLSAMHQEMRTLLLQERETLDQLYTQFKAEQDPLLSFEIQKQIQQLKIETEISVIRIQADHARKDGREEDAKRIEQELSVMINRAQLEAANATTPERPSNNASTHR